MRGRALTLLLVAFVAATAIIFPTPIAEAQNGTAVDSIDTGETTIQEIAWDGSNLWYLGTDETVVLRELNPANGSEVDSVNLNEEQVRDANGLSASNESVWLLSSKQADENGEVYRINSSSGLTEKTIPTPMTDPEGLAYDGSQFWTLNGDSDTLESFNPDTGEENQSVQLPTGYLGGNVHLTWGNGFLWATNGQSIVQIDISGGVANIVNRHDTSVYSPTGLIWDGEYFWVGETTAINRIDIGMIGEPNSPPNATFSYSQTPVSAEERTQFNASSSNDSNGYIQSYSWDFTGDGVADARGERVNYTFSGPGNYTIRLNVTDNGGYSNITTENITVAASTTTQQTTPAAATTEQTTLAATTTALTTSTGAEEALTSSTTASNQENEANTTSTTDSSDGQSGAFGPGFGIAGAVVSLLVAISVGIRRRR